MNCIISRQIAEHCDDSMSQAIEAEYQARIDQFKERIISGEAITLVTGKVIQSWHLSQYVTDFVAFEAVIEELIRANYRPEMYQKSAMKLLADRIERAAQEMAEEHADYYRVIGGDYEQ